MARRLVIIDRETPLLMPPSIQEWVADDDLARFVAEAVEMVADHTCHYNWRGSGSRQYPPRMMLALLIYCYANGVFTSRRIERATYRDVAVRYLTADHHPDHDTIASFRRENGPLFKACFVQVLELAREMKIKRLGEVALDGSKLEADAAKRSTRVLKDLREESMDLERQVAQLMKAAEAADHADASKPDGTRLSDELAVAGQRHDRMTRAMDTLKEKTRLASKAREEERAAFDRRGPGEPARPLAPEPVDTATATATVNLTDPDARLLPQKKRRLPAVLQRADRRPGRHLRPPDPRHRGMRRNQ